MQWGFFDGAYPILYLHCNVGFVLDFFDSHFLLETVNLVQGTTNLGEFEAFFLLLKCALNNNLTHIQVSSELTLVINRLNCENQLVNLGI